MMEELEVIQLKTYLLGKSKDEGETEELETKLMVDDEFFEKLTYAEDELIEEYIDGELNADDITHFENHFLLPAERREKLKLTQFARRNGLESVIDLPVKIGWKLRFESFIRSFLSPIPIAVSILIACSLIFFWWNNSSTSDSKQIQNALISLNKAYSAERPSEYRITGLDYAPFDKTRSEPKSKVNTVEKDRAERVALDLAAENPTAENQYLLARLYLTDKEFDKALEQLEEALKKSPRNPDILNEIGTVYLEKRNLSQKDEEKIALMDKALQKFNEALAINPNLATAKFNKAVATEIYLPNRAKQVWEEYLQLDPNSAWADEAKKRLADLNKQTSENNLSAEDLEVAFRQAFDEKNDEKALQIVSQNREMIAEMYLPQKFAMEIVRKKKTPELNRSNS
jgi:tetratricopeptide (TPR) repeat protein